MNARKITVSETNFSKCRTIDIHKIYYPIGKAGFLKYAHKHLSTVHLRIGRFPDNYVSAHCSRGWQVSTNCCKVEWGYGKHEPFKRPILHTVMHTRTTDRLLFVY